MLMTPVSRGELIEKWDEPGARRLLFAELAAIRLWSRQARQRATAADSCGPLRRAQGISKWAAGDGEVWLISAIDCAGVLLGTEVHLADGDLCSGRPCRSPWR